LKLMEDVEMSHVMKTPEAGSEALARRCVLVLESLESSGLLGGKTESIAARVNPKLLRLAKRSTGLESTSALVELALANLVVEDGFPDAFARARGRVPADMDLDL
jgi:hypothetical protein